MQTWEKIKHNPALLDRYFIREKVTDAIRSFFKDRGFHEIQSPVLVSIPSCEPNLEVFKTQLKTYKGINKDAYLIMSPEYSIKKLLSAGIGNCFEITRCFRNGEEVSALHNPEFTMLEWYRVNADYMDIMNDFEQLFIKIVGAVNPHPPGQRKTKLTKWKYQNESYDLTRPWVRIAIKDAFKKYAGIDTETLLSSKLLKKAGSKGYKIYNKTSWEEVFNQILFNEVEPALQKLHKPYFLYDYPTHLASLSKKKSSDPRFAERFEAFLAGIELGNCFSELTNVNEQKTRFEKDLDERKGIGKSNYPMDNELLKALSEGMPESAGIAVGVDRLIMLAGDFENISDTLFFPAKEIFDLPET